MEGDKKIKEVIDFLARNRIKTIKCISCGSVSTCSRLCDWFYRSTDGLKNKQYGITCYDCLSDISKEVYEFIERENMGDVAYELFTEQNKRSLKLEEKEKGKELVIPMARHSLMSGDESDYFKKENERYELADKLGLTKQVSKSIEKVYEKDVKHLTKDKYPQVTLKILEKLFRYKTIKRDAMMFNISSVFGSKLKYPAILIFLVFPFMWYFGVDVIPNFINIAGVWKWFGVLLMILLSIVCVVSVWFFADDMEDLTYNIPFKKVRLVTESFESSDVRIPHEGLLRYKKAKESGIFNQFMIIRPDVSLTESVPHLHLKDEDPAIVGLTKNEKMYLVCYFDAETDEDETEAKMAELKKYKVKD